MGASLSTRARALHKALHSLATSAREPTSRFPCLQDLLIRHAAGDLNCDIAFVASNHTTLKPIADQFNVAFHHVSIDKEAHEDVESAKHAQEHVVRRMLADERVDCVVLARYMQVLSASFCDEWAGRCINIHHSFLPAFEGARPYHRAHERGVKLIGATAHYVSKDLDAGPIIVQVRERTRLWCSCCASNELKHARENVC